MAKHFSKPNVAELSCLEPALDLSQSEPPKKPDKGNTRRPPTSTGPFAKSRADHKNNGVSSADPRVISGNQDGDATFPLEQDKSRPED